MKVFLALAALVAVTAASGVHLYNGLYPGKCGADGLYYRNSKSFVYCSNGNSYVQPCAPGTQNSAYGKFSNGGYYGYYDFCNVNLNDGDYVEKYKVGEGYTGPLEKSRPVHGYRPYPAYGNYGAYPAQYGYAPYGLW